MTDFNLQFDIASLIILSVLIFFSYKSVRNGQSSSKVFLIYLFFIFANAAIDIFAIILVNNYEDYPLLLSKIVNTVYIAFQALLPTFYLAFIMVMFKDSSKKENHLFIYLILPAILLMLLVVTLNPSNGFIFYFDENGQYQHGDFHKLIFSNFIFYSIISLLILILSKNKTNKDKLPMMFIILLVGIVIASFQILFPKEMIGNYAITISALMMFLTFQNPKADFDFTTGLLNKYSFGNKLFNMFNNPKNRAFFSIALSNFSRINDAYGIEGGNIIIRNIAKKIFDASCDKSIYRFGGDKFVIVFNDIDNLEKKEKEVIDALSQPIFMNGELITISARYARIVTSHLPYTNDFIQDKNFIIKVIDYANNESKKEPHNKVLIVGTHIIEEIKKQMLIEHYIDDAIAKRKFEVHFQPIYNMETKKFDSAEALARLNTEKYGYISPDIFINIAEQNGQIIPLGLLIFEEVCRFLSTIDLEKIDLKEISVNLSTMQGSEAGHSKKLIAILEEYHLNPRYINFEVTETLRINSEKNIKKNMEELIDYGFRFHLDDFGTGYSTIDYMTHLPFSVIKLDRSLITNAIKETQSKVVLGHVSKMIKDLGRKMIAEGVETIEMVNLIEELKIDYIQGFYYSKPLPIDKYLKFLKDNL